MSAASRPNLLADGHGTRFPVTSPEGVPLEFEIASAGSRISAVILDYLLIFGGLVALLLIHGLIFRGDGGIGIALVMIGIFLLVHFYFTFFEVRWQGSTPGKRASGIRVINRTGGPVTGEAVVTRNFLRMVEVFIPLQMLLGAAFSSDGAPWYLTLFGLAWIVILALLPLFNRHRLRLGDLAAGTVVVAVPRTQLLRDVGEGKDEQAATHGYVFTREQLEVYGEYELQVLEEVLRRGDIAGSGNEQTLQLVKDKIVRKIAWPHPVKGRETRRFLEAYYASLRAHREQRMLFGKRKRDKFADEGMTIE